ncbi:hypothetical protein B0H10DRAFT_2039433 [Mycena sp. CBHHK59/15]|nr:hypothetical protein B0H10DRAFT_2039433 [Mycena sp. CBHHK59/15]
MRAWLAPSCALFVLVKKLSRRVERVAAEVCASCKVFTMAVWEVWDAARSFSWVCAKLPSSAMPCAICSWRPCVSTNCCRRVTPSLKSCAAVAFWRVRTAACWPMPITTLAWRPAANDWSPWSQGRVRVAAAALLVPVAAVLLSLAAELSTVLVALLAPVALLALAAEADDLEPLPARLLAAVPLAPLTLRFLGAGAATTDVTAIKAKRAAKNFMMYILGGFQRDKKSVECRQMNKSMDLPEGTNALRRSGRTEVASSWKESGGVKESSCESELLEGAPCQRMIGALSPSR